MEAGRAVPPPIHSSALRPIEAIQSQNLLEKIDELKAGGVGEIKRIDGSFKEIHGAQGVIDIATEGEGFKLQLEWSIETDRDIHKHVEDLTVTLKHPPLNEKTRYQMILIAVKTYRRMMKAAANKGDDAPLANNKVQALKNSHLMKIRLPTEGEMLQGNYQARVIDPAGTQEFSFSKPARANAAKREFVEMSKSARIDQQAGRICDYYRSRDAERSILLPLAPPSHRATMAEVSTALPVSELPLHQPHPEVDKLEQEILLAHERDIARLADEIRALKIQLAEQRKDFADLDHKVEQIRTMITDRKLADIVTLIENLEIEIEQLKLRFNVR